MTRSEFITQNQHLFWYIRKDKLQDISNEVLVEFVFNHGTWQNVKDLVQIIGYQELKRVYENTNGRKIGNYYPEMYDLLKRIVLKYAS